ncbi:glycosyl transferase family 2 [Neobacillus sp. K501]
MLDKFEKIKIHYNQLERFQFPSPEPFILKVQWEGVEFDFLIKMKELSSHLIILGSGAMNYQEKRVKPPYFQRHSWIDDLEDSVIFYNDPTLYLGEELLLGWGQGTFDRFYLNDIADILEILIKKSQVPFKKVLFYGSSGGGFMSLILAGFLKDSSVLVNSPQTCLTQWLKVPVQQVFNRSYPKMSEQEIMNKFPDRVNVIKFYYQKKYVPKIFYLQNVYCELDVENHLIPFMQGLRKMGPDCVVNPVKIDLYYNVQPGPAVLPEIGGHGALGKEETINYINKIKTEL